MKKSILFLAVALAIALSLLAVRSFKAPPYSAPPRPREEDQVDLATLITKSARGDTVAQTALGKCYALGHGVPRDYTIAAQWYLKAAKLGAVDAQAGLGELYEAGRGVR